MIFLGRIDTDFCTGTISAPQPNGKMDSLKFQTLSGDEEDPKNSESDQTTVQEWIKSIENGPAPDRLTIIDRVIDASIGGMGDRMEYIKGTQTKVPLFEFRSLANIKIQDFPDMVSNAEKEVLDYHQKYAKPARLVRPRGVRQRLDANDPLVKRKNGSSACAPAGITGVSSTDTAASATTSTPLTTDPALSCEYHGPMPPLTPEAFCSCGSSSLPLVSIPGTPVKESLSCAYTAPPSTSITTQLHDAAPSPVTNTDLCQICTPYAANGANCVPLPSCTPKRGYLTVDLGSSAVNVGVLTAAPLYTSISSAINKLCPTGGPVCATSTIDIGGIHYAEKGLEETDFYEDGTIHVSVLSSSYTDQKIRDSLIQASAAAANYSATDKMCQQIEGMEYSKKKRSSAPDSGLSKRQYPIGSGGTNGWHPVKETFTLCSSLSFTGAQYIAPGVNNQNIGTSISHIDTQWTFEASKKAEYESDLICDFVTEAIDVLGIEVPVLAGETGAAVGLVCKKGLVQAIQDTAGNWAKLG